MITSQAVCEACGRDFSGDLDDPDVVIGGPCPAEDCPSRDSDFVDWNIFLRSEPANAAGEGLDDWIEALTSPGECGPPTTIREMAVAHARRLCLPVHLEGFRVRVHENGMHSTDTSAPLWAGRAEPDGSVVRIA